MTLPVVTSDPALGPKPVRLGLSVSVCLSPGSVVQVGHEDQEADSFHF